MNNSLDIWKHGKYLDLWSLVHFFSGLLGATVLFKFQLEPHYVFLIAIIGAIAWELFEKYINILENIENILMDILIAMLGAASVYYFQHFFVSHEIFWSLAVLNAALALWGFLDFKKRGYR